MRILERSHTFSKTSVYSFSKSPESISVINTVNFSRNHQKTMQNKHHKILRLYEAAEISLSL